MTRRRPSAWPTVIGAVALFIVVFQLIAFQPTAGQVNGRTAPVKAKPAVAAVAPQPAPIAVVSSTS
jgi:hypothetical protein